MGDVFQSEDNLKIDISVYLTLIQMKKKFCYKIDRFISGASVIKTENF